jgi:hypothetical protein
MRDDAAAAPTHQLVRYVADLVSESPGWCPKLYPLQSWGFSVKIRPRVPTHVTVVSKLTELAL